MGVCGGVCVCVVYCRDTDVMVQNTSTRAEVNTSFDSPFKQSPLVLRNLTFLTQFIGHSCTAEPWTIVACTGNQPPMQVLVMPLCTRPIECH